MSNTTKKIKEIVYGLGGFDESKPNNNVIETIYYSDEELSQLEIKRAQNAAKSALLERLGITEEEARLLLG